MTNNASEPAYPALDLNSCGDLGLRYSGLTKREAFAMAAMQAEIGLNDDVSISSLRREIALPDAEPYDYAKHWPRFVAKRACAYADALLAELEKK